MDVDNSVVMAGEGREVENGIAGRMVMDRDLARGGQHTVHCTGGVL